jgi:putative hemolysin
VIRGLSGVTSTLADRTRPRTIPAAFLDRFSRGRDLKGLSPVLERSGSLEARLAVTKRDVRAAQRLRYRVFFEEGDATPDPTARLIRRDVCRFDAHCDHLLVVDHDSPRRDGSPKVVGVYRLMTQDAALAGLGFYSAGEFDLAPLLARHPGKRFMELGRACIARSHRGRRTLDLLWRGIWTYARHHRIDALFGCASLPGVEVETHAASIAALISREEGDASWRVSALAGRAAPTPGTAQPVADLRASIRALPPLVKGYWRLGATFSREPVVDAAFGATDLFVTLQLADIGARYLDYFGVGDPARPLAA